MQSEASPQQTVRSSYARASTSCFVSLNLAPGGKWPRPADVPGPGAMTPGPGTFRQRPVSADLHLKVWVDRIKVISLTAGEVLLRELVVGGAAMASVSTPFRSALTDKCPAAALSA